MGRESSENSPNRSNIRAKLFKNAVNYCGLSLRHGASTASWLFASTWKLFARARGRRFVVCGAGAVSQRILLGLPRLLRAPFSCATCIRSLY